VGGSPYIVNAEARRLYGGDPWVGELLCVADIIQGYVRRENVTLIHGLVAVHGW
jgi:hypothetical protein